MANKLQMALVINFNCTNRDGCFSSRSGMLGNKGMGWDKLLINERPRHCNRKL